MPIQTTKFGQFNAPYDDAIFHSVSADHFYGAAGSSLSGDEYSICATTTATTVSTNPISRIIKIYRTAKTSTTAIDGSLTASINYNIPLAIRYLFVGGTLTANLPSAVGLGGLAFTIKSNGNPLALTLSALNGTIDGSNFLYIDMPYISFTCVSNNTNWFIG